MVCLRGEATLRFAERLRKFLAGQCGRLQYIEVKLTVSLLCRSLVRFSLIWESFIIEIEVVCGPSLAESSSKKLTGRETSGAA